MTNLPSQHPELSLHLTDSTLTPLITSSSSPSHLDSLTSLASTALTSHSAVARVNLGHPQRIMVEYPDRGAVVLQTYIDPQHHTYQPPPSTTTTQPNSPPPAVSSRSRQSSRPASSKAGHLDSAPPPLHNPSSSSLAASQSHSTTTATARTIDPEDAPPRLVGVVVAGSADQTREARRAAARLERVGRDFQREWVSDSSRTYDETLA